MITGNRIFLRLMEKEDLEFFCNKSNDISSFDKNWPTWLYPLEQIKKMHQENGMWTDERGFLLICQKETKKVMGYVKYFKPVPHYNGLELGFVIFDKQDRNRGFASESVGLVAKFLFSLKDIQRIQIVCSEENVFSQKIALKNNFSYEGTLRQAFYIHGKYVNSKIYSVLKSEVDSIV